MKRSAVGLLLFYKEKSEENENMKTYKIAVAGTGYVGLSLSVLLAQHNQVMAVDIVQAKVDMINNHKSPIQDDYIEKYLAEKELNLTATLDAKAACKNIRFENCVWDGINNNGDQTIWTFGIRLRERVDAAGNKIWCENIWIEGCIFQNIWYNPCVNNGRPQDVSGAAILP